MLALLSAASQEHYAFPFPKLEKTAVFGRKMGQLARSAFNQGSISLVAMSISGTPRRPGEISVAFSGDPVLAVWQAMKPLAEIGARTDAPDIAKIVTEAEIILFGLVRDLSRRLENSESTAINAIRRNGHFGP